MVLLLSFVMADGEIRRELNWMSGGEWGGVVDGSAVDSG